MRVAVVGVGGIGGYFGGRLIQAGVDTVLVARGQHLAALRTDGLRIESAAGDVHLPRVIASDDPASLGRVDAVLMCVKAWQVGQAAGIIAPMVRPETLVVPLQNGVDAPGELARVLGPAPVAGGLCWIVSELARAGHVVHRAADPTIVFGELDNRRSDRVEWLHQVLASAPGVRSMIAEDIRLEMWRKFLFIAAVSGVGAVARVAVGDWRAEPETRRLLRAAMDEIVRVAASQDVALGADRIDEALRFLDGLGPGAIPSMQRDLTGGRPSELEQQTGAVVRLGEAVGIDVPVNRFLLAILRPLERRARLAPS